MGGSSFDLLIEQVTKQYQMMEALEEENRQLRRQLTDLREGRNIFLDIYGQRFTLDGEAITEPPEVMTTPTADKTPAEKIPAIVEAPTIAMNKISATPVPQAQQTTDASAVQDKSQVTSSTFLEEMMIQEFASAMPNSKAIWTGPATKPEPVMSEEQKNAALRRELMGSFLLE
jgi:hypothetical protein